MRTQVGNMKLSVKYGKGLNHVPVASKVDKLKQQQPSNSSLFHIQKHSLNFLPDSHKLYWLEY
jgi:hypothetical protein